MGTKEFTLLVIRNDVERITVYIERAKAFILSADRKDVERMMPYM